MYRLYSVQSRLMAMKEELNILIQAQYPLIYLVTSEEERAEQAISIIAQANRSAASLFGQSHTVLNTVNPVMLAQYRISRGGDRVDNPAARSSIFYTGFAPIY